MEAKEILSLIGFPTPEEGAEVTLDAIRDYHSENFITKDSIKDHPELIKPFISDALGKKLGPLQSKLISSARDAGLEITHADFKDKQLEDIIPELFSGIGEKLKGHKVPDTKLQEDFNRVKSENAQLQESLGGFQEQLQLKDQEFAEKEKNWVVTYADAEAWKKVPFASTVDEYKRLGFETKVKSEFELMVDENKTVYPVYKTGDKKGSRVQNPANVKEYLKWDELLTIKAKEAGMSPTPHDGKSTKPANGQAPPRDVPERKEGARKMHPNFSRS